MEVFRLEISVASTRRAPNQAFLPSFSYGKRLLVQSFYLRPVNTTDRDGGVVVFSELVSEHDLREPNRLYSIVSPMELIFGLQGSSLVR